MTTCSRLSGAALGIAMATLVAACSPEIDTHGNFPKEDIIESIRPGATNRQGVTQILGTPSTVAMFEDEVWYYIGQQVEQIAFFTPTVLERKIIAIRFNERGVVDEVKRYGLADQRDVQIVERITPTKGKELTVIDQILGNIGRFSTDESQ